MSRGGLDLLAATGAVIAVRRRRRPRVPLLTGLAAIMLLGLSQGLHPTPRVVWNASASAPVGLYRVAPPVQLRRGDLVLATPPEPARELAAERGYLPAGVPLVKRVAALSGDLVCVLGGDVWIGSTIVARQLPADRSGRPLPRWDGCRTLVDGEVFLLMAEVPDSFDSRYFGPIPRKWVIGRLVALWTR